MQPKFEWHPLQIVDLDVMSARLSRWSAAARPCSDTAGTALASIPSNPKAQALLQAADGQELVIDAVSGKVLAKD